jgi:hypothetical protein
MYQSARTLRIADGPDEVHKIMIAKLILRRYHSGESWDFGNCARVPRARPICYHLRESRGCGLAAAGSHHDDVNGDGGCRSSRQRNAMRFSTSGGC